MERWADLSKDCYAAATKLLREEHFPSSISRFYYAAYAGLTEELAEVVTFAKGWNNPAHEVLPRLIDSNLPAVDRNVRRRLKAAIRRLYDARTNADYFPQREVGNELARRCLRDAYMILSSLRILT